MERTLTKPIRVLVVEDNEDHALLLQRAFRGKKWAVDIAANGNDALAMLEKPYDVVLLDYRLPDIDGLDLLDRIRRREPAKAVIFITGEGSEEVAMRALSFGAMDYVVKRTGYDIAIVDVVEDALAKRDALQDVEATPNRAALDKVLDSLRLGGAVKAMLVASPAGKPLAFKLPKQVSPEVVAAAMGRIKADGDALSAHFRSGCVYVHIRFGALGVLLEPVGGRALLVTFLDPPEAVASARVLTRQAIQAISDTWNDPDSPPRDAR